MTNTTNNINYTKYVTTPKGRFVKGPARDDNGVPKSDSMGTVIEVGVAEALTLSPPPQISHIDTPIALTTEQLKDLGILGRVLRKKGEKESPAEEKERKIQTHGLDIIIFPKALIDWLLTPDGAGMFTYDRMMKHCLTVQVKYQPHAHQYKTINFETHNRNFKHKGNDTAYDDHHTQHNAHLTAYVVTSQVVILAETGKYKELCKGDAKPIGAPYFYRGFGNKYHRRQTFTHRINISTLLSDSATSVLGMSPLFEEYHLKAREALEPCEGWEDNSIHYWYYAQNWSLSVMKNYLLSGSNALVADGELKEGVTLQGGIH